MKKINLLPPRVQKAKDVRRISFIIAAVQAAIFLAAILVYVFVFTWEARLNREIHVLSIVLRDNPTEQQRNQTFHNFFAEDFLKADALINAQTAPSGIVLYAMRFGYGEISITARTADILNIQTHMELLDELFYDIRLVGLGVTDDGIYVYELIILER